MICVHCIIAGEMNKSYSSDAEKLHKLCEGCVCQHKTGPGWVVTKGSKVPLMQTQSP